jgi:alpha,alpha-trehalase
MRQVFRLRTARGDRSFEVRGTSRLSQLLQLLSLARLQGNRHILLNQTDISLNPVVRLSKYIRDVFWSNSAASLDRSTIARTGTYRQQHADNDVMRIYIPIGAPEQFEHYADAESRFSARWLDYGNSSSHIHGTENEGYLALAMEEGLHSMTGDRNLKGVPFVECGEDAMDIFRWYGYMDCLGLLACDEVDLARSIVENICFCIQHYGKVPFRNRIEYINCSQPPFLTDMARRVYSVIQHQQGAHEFLQRATLAAIKDYEDFWMVGSRVDEISGLSRYFQDGSTVPTNMQHPHLSTLLDDCAKNHGLPVDEFVQAYNAGEIEEPDLKEYLRHLWATLETGHINSYRFEGKCADLLTVDLNSLLYKYELDIAQTIRVFFKDQLVVSREFSSSARKMDSVLSASVWERRAKRRKRAVDKYLWNKEIGMYLDYDWKKQRQVRHESATTFWPLWAGLASPQQAAEVALQGTRRLGAYGGLSATSEESRARTSFNRPNLRCDYPYGWAPHQVLAWMGLVRYGFQELAQRLAYRWLLMITRTFDDYGGIIVEIYDVNRPIDPHRVEAEAKVNLGSNFRGVPLKGCVIKAPGY